MRTLSEDDGTFPLLQLQVRNEGIGIIHEGGILALFAQGYKNAEIADRLVISPKTVRNYVSNIISKLQVADRAQAILRAKDAGFGITGSNS